MRLTLLSLLLATACRSGGLLPCAKGYERAKDGVRCNATSRTTWYQDSGYSTYSGSFTSYYSSYSYSYYTYSWSTYSWSTSGGYTTYPTGTGTGASTGTGTGAATGTGTGASTGTGTGAATGTGTGATTP